jgi:hypothetical protein
VHPVPELVELPTGTAGWLVGLGGILTAVFAFFLKRQKQDDAHEGNLARLLISRMEKIERDAAAAIASAMNAAAAASAQMKDLHEQCTRENAALREKVGRLELVVERLQADGAASARSASRPGTRRTRRGT